MEFVDHQVDDKLIGMLAAYQVHRFEKLIYDEVKRCSLNYIEKLLHKSEHSQQIDDCSPSQNHHQTSLAHQYYNLGRIYHFGFGSTSSDLSQAWKFYKYAAQFHHPTAIYQLGKLCGYHSCGYPFVKQLKNRHQVAIYRVRKYVTSASINPWCCQADYELTNDCKTNKIYYSALFNLKMSHLRLLSSLKDHEETKDFKDKMININSPDNLANGTTVKLSTLYCQLGYTIVKLSQLNGENIDVVAYQYFTKAAKLGNSSGFIHLAIWKYSLNGSRNIMDFEEAYHLFHKADQLDHSQASFYLLYYYYTKFISTANDRYVDLASVHSDRALSFPFASPLYYTTLLSLLRETGCIDPNQCLSNLKLSIVSDDYFNQNGVRLSYLTLGHIYKKGDWVKIDYSIAAHCFSRAAVLGQYQGIIEVAKLVEKGKIAVADIHTAIKLYRSVIDLTNVPNQVQAMALKRLGQLYIKMKITGSHHRGKDWIAQALNKFQQDNFDPMSKCCALYQIARIYHKGLGDDLKDLAKAASYYHQVLACSHHYQNPTYPTKAKRKLNELEKITST